MFATVWPGRKFTFEAVGTGEPEGQTVRYPGAVGSATVTLSATATAPAGTPPTPTIWR